MARQTLRSRIGIGRDDGSALVAVIGVMVVLTILVMTIVSTALSNVRTTTVTRASVQAKGAAEAGIDFAQAQLAAGAAACGSSFGAPSGSAITYQVVVSCPSAGSVLVRSTGAATSPGIGGPEGNKRTMEARLSVAAAAPRFDKAVFIGSMNTHLNSSWKLNGVAAGDPNVGGYYGRGNFSCSSGGTISGPIVIVGDAYMTGCAITGDMFVKGDLTGCDGGTIVGNLYVQGRSTGSLNCTITGSVYVAGDIASVSGTISGYVVSSKGTITGWSNGRVNGGVTVKTLPPTLEAAQVKGVSCADPSWSTPRKYGCAAGITLMTSVLPLLPADGFDEQMPTLTGESSSWPGAVQQPWASYVRGVYATHGATATDPNRFASDAKTCTLRAAATVSKDSSGDALNGPIVSPGVPTVLDARGCDKLQLRDSTIVLNDDLTILAKNYTSTNGLSVVKGPLSPAGQTPALRIIVPMKDGSTTCSENSTAGTIVFNSGGTNLGPAVSLMLYSAGLIDISNTMSFHGQVYTCKLPDAKNTVTINFRAVGDEIGGGPAGDGGYELMYLRDLSGTS